ncbi:MAG: hypothetical protein WC626_10850 [Methanoregula sp.]
MAFSKLELRIIDRVALSPEKLSAWDLKDLGHYTNVHKSCKNFIENGMLEYDSVKNEKGAPKKVFRLTLRSFCNFVSTSELFSRILAGYDYPEDKLSNICLFLEQWKHLHEGIEGFNSIFMKYRDQTKFPGIESHILLAFRHGCENTLLLDDGIRDARLKGSTDIPETSTIENIFLSYLIKNLIELPAETSYTVSFWDLTNMFKRNTDGFNEVEEQLVQKVKDGEELYQWYIHYF